MKFNKKEINFLKRNKNEIQELLRKRLEELKNLIVFGEMEEEQRNLLRVFSKEIQNWLVWLDQISNISYNKDKDNFI